MIGMRESLDLLLPYLRRCLVDQVRSVAFIVSYLVIFQVWVLRIPIVEASTIAIGIGLVVIGLALFMEGLKIGLMPLGESLGLKLPRRSPLPAILLFALILGVGATFAEPAIGVLRAAGASVKAWEAPLLFMLLNQHANTLVIAVAGGVGLAVMLGMLRFLYNWSLKPLLYVFVPIVLLLSFYSLFDTNTALVLGLAWDSGAVTTGPVTVPLVLALGIGISRVVAGHTEEGVAGGFGVVTLASLLPIIMVLLLAQSLKPLAPAPMPEEDFFAEKNREPVLAFFGSKKDLWQYALYHADSKSWESLAGSEQSLVGIVQASLTDSTMRKQHFGAHADPRDVKRWLFDRADQSLQLAALGSAEKLFNTRQKLRVDSEKIAWWPQIKSSFLGSAQAILPLTLFLLLVFRVFLRERFAHADEIFFGIGLALIGMSVFFLGIDTGLSKLGKQVGGRLPAAYTAIELPEHETTVIDFDRNVLQTAISADGQIEQFFYVPGRQDYRPVQFHEAYFNEETRHYRYVPQHGPIFAGQLGLTGIVVVIGFAFFMGYGATLAEPALNALGATVEDLTVGTFKKSLLIQTVGIGVGVGISLGVAKIIWDLPLFWMLAPPYLLLVLLSALSSEQFVNIGWDSAGVTTGPITVPLVLAMGLGIGVQSGVAEGFGILAMASVSPILAVLLVGAYVNKRQRRILDGA